MAEVSLRGHRHTIRTPLHPTSHEFSLLPHSIQNLISASMKAKITAYVIVLALHINNFQTDLTVLQNDMKLPESR